MNVLDAVFKYLEHRIPPSNPNPEEDVYNMRYRNRYFSLFPEDLNEDYDPYDFIEEPVEPRSFRKILTGLIGWTVVLPFILFLLLYQKNIETLSSLVVDRQSLSTLLIKMKLDSVDSSLHSLSIKALNDYLSHSHGDGGLSAADARGMYQTVRARFPNARMRIKDLKTSNIYSFEPEAWKAVPPHVTILPFNETGLQEITMEISLPVDSLAAVIGSAVKGTGAEAFLVDDSGRVLYATDPSLPFDLPDFGQIKKGLVINKGI